MRNRLPASPHRIRNSHRTQNPPPQGVPVRFRPRAPQIRPEASTSFRPFSFSLWEAALTSARTCAEVCRNPGVCGGTNGGTFWKSGGTSLHVPPTRAAQAGPLVLTSCLMTPAARHYPPEWPGHNLTPLGRVTQQCAGAARITRTEQSQGEPTSGGQVSTVHRPPFQNAMHSRTDGARITRTTQSH